MKMTLKDHKEIGVIVCKECAHFKELSKRFSRVANAHSQSDVVDVYFNYAKAYDLISSALRDIIHEYDFDCVIAGDNDDKA